PFLAIAPKGTAWHSREAAAAAASPQAHETAVKAAKAFGMTAIDIFSDSNLVGRIRDEFMGERNRLPQ
ncbi:MAG: hypothetical protein NTY64_11310, partial [Deltaproteobacteria bacterium]|nr:hypothetical protein [Deltaproteobacteria bacterium]